MKVVAYDPYITEERFNKMGVVDARHWNLLKQSDLILFILQKQMKLTA